MLPCCETAKLVDEHTGEFSTARDLLKGRSQGRKRASFMDGTAAVPAIQRPSLFLDQIRTASWPCIVFVCAAEATAAGLYFWNSGVLTLALTWLVIIGVGIFAWARLRPADLGIRFHGILLSVAYAVAWLSLSWVMLWTLAVAQGLRAERPVVKGNIGPLADQLLFFALSEEIVFRGFLFGQLYRKLRSLRWSMGLKLLIAVTSTQIFFALIHIPHRIHEHVPAADLAMNLALTAAFGVLFCLVYFRTGNLFVPLVVHAVYNVQALLPSQLSWRTKNVSMALAALIVAQLYAWLFPTARRGER